mmetsp:Transcript_11059/g.37642  ORF Transcript_11059/g.37642 Transcript_11059/m.37642 type:complete len:213 (-) Transcript_11059:431-1069(-)
MRPPAHQGDGPLDQGALQGGPHSGLPRVHRAPVWQGGLHQPPPPVRQAPRGQEGHIRGLRGLPERGQVVHHQHPAQEEGVLRGAHPGRDQGLAVHHALAAHLPHRLPRHGAALGRDGDGARAQGRGAHRARGGLHGPRGRRPRACQARAHRAHVRRGLVAGPRGLPLPARPPDGQAPQGRGPRPQHGGQEGDHRLAPGPPALLRAPGGEPRG